MFNKVDVNTGGLVFAVTTSSLTENTDTVFFLFLEAPIEINSPRTIRLHILYVEGKYELADKVDQFRKHLNSFFFCTTPENLRNT